MEYTDHGLRIPLDELRRLLQLAENRVQYDSMESCIYITPGDRPRIVQYCGYAECNPIYYTNSVR